MRIWKSLGENVVANVIASIIIAGGLAVIGLIESLFREMSWPATLAIAVFTFACVFTIVSAVVNVWIRRPANDISARLQLEFDKGITHVAQGQPLIYRIKVRLINAVSSALIRCVLEEIEIIDSYEKQRFNDHCRRLNMLRGKAFQRMHHPGKIEHELQPGEPAEFDIVASSDCDRFLMLESIDLIYKQLLPLKYRLAVLVTASNAKPARIVLEVRVNDGGGLIVNENTPS